MARALENLQRLSASSIEGGLLEDAPPYPSGAAVAEVGALYELGQEGHASRSFLRATIDEQESRYLKMLAAAVKVGKPTMLRRISAALYRDLRRAVKRKGLYRTGHLFRSIRTRVNDGPVGED
jgi:hypothetical protein